jgi:alkyldihydroxyacetonephosphate synthase
VALARPRDLRPELSWWSWGDEAQVPELPGSVKQLIGQALGARGVSGRAQRLSDVALPPVRLPPATGEQLTAVVGAANAAADDETRARHAGGKSTPDLLRIRAGHAPAAPDLVLFPAKHDDVLELLTICSAERIAVVPFGGGTSVVGGLQPDASNFNGVIAVDTRRMNALVELDEESRLAVLEPGLRGPEAEGLLSQRGFTLGHFPQSFEYGTLGGFAAARSSGQASAGYGRFDDLVVAMRVATPSGTLNLGRAPKSAAGPDLRQLVLGSEGTLGVITSLTVQVRPRPQQRKYEGWRFNSFADGIAAVRRLVQDGPVPTVVRISDETETALNLAHPEQVGAAGGAGSLAIIGYEGTSEQVAWLRDSTRRTLAAARAAPDPDAGEAWARDRFRGPYLRDALLDAGALVETLETACFWSGIPALYGAVSKALRKSLTAVDTPPVVMCHISHVYPAGASLYFTVACAAGEEPIAGWRTAKAAASDAIISSGGSISHHHGIGTDHRRWLVDEVGELGVRTLRAIKRTLDPEGIMNPGILLDLDEA